MALTLTPTLVLRSNLTPTLTPILTPTHVDLKPYLLALVKLWPVSIDLLSMDYFANNSNLKFLFEQIEDYFLSNLKKA